MANNNHSKPRRLLLVLLAIIVAVIIFAAFISMRRSEVPVRTEKVSRGTIVSAISTNGKVEALNNFEAHAPGPITVKRVFVHEGDHVKPGQMLVQLDNSDAVAQLAKAQAQLRATQADIAAVQNGGTREEVITNQAQLAKAKIEFESARRNLEALQRLQQKGAASADEVVAAQNRLNSAQADLKLAQEKSTARYSGPEIARVRAAQSEARASVSAAQELVNQTEIRSPSAGTVYALPVHAGQYVNAGELIVAVADINQMQVRIFVDEPDLGKLQVGQKIDVSWDALPGRTWTGQITRLPASVSSRGTRTVGEVTSLVQNPDAKLLPNVNVNVSIITARDQNALIVPREAVYQDDGQRFMYEVVDGRLVRRDVKTSISNLTQIEVIQGINDGATIAINATNGQPLATGLAVRGE